MPLERGRSSFYTLIDLRGNGGKAGAFDRNDAFCFYIPECLGTDACQSGTDRDGLKIPAVIEGLASDGRNIMSDYNTGKLLLIGKGLAPYRSYLVGGTCIFDGERYDSLAKTAVGSSIAGDGLLSLVTR